MINWISSQGWEIHIAPGWITVIKGHTTGNYTSIKKAYFALGGPLNSNLHNPRGLRP